METIKHFCLWSEVRLKSTQIFIIAGTVLLTLIITVLCIGFLIRYEVESEVANVSDVDYWNDRVSTEQRIWYEKGIEELNNALNTYVGAAGFPRNVLIFYANGVDADLLSAARFHQSKLPGILSWDRFPHIARLRNNCSTADLCDASSLATTLFGGVRPNFGLAGLDASVSFRNCSAAQQQEHHVKSVLHQAQVNKLRTGFVTTQRLTGPTGAALFAHVPDTSWECDGTMSHGYIANGCEDIAQQFIHGETGKHLNVAMGGGRQTLSARVPKTDWDTIDESVCQRAGNINLLSDWQHANVLSGNKFEVVQRAAELKQMNVSDIDYLLGVFANGDLARVSKEAPKLVDMLRKALDVLSRKETGYLLLAEQYFHAELSKSEKLNALLQLNATIEEIMQHKRFSITDTLVLLVCTKANYITYGIDTSDETELITDFGDVIENDALLSQRLNDIVEDTVVFGHGPKAMLLHHVHEETYMAHLISYALKMGIFQQK